jgi:two-component system phosphate regulon sensor histidine kinase PhoR
LLSLGVRGKLIIISIGVISVSTLVAYAYLSSELERGITLRMREELTVRASLVALQATKTSAGRDEVAAWDAFADAAAISAVGRVSIIRADGVVLGDSQVAAARLSMMENHAQRPEVRNALLGDRGIGERESATVGQRLLYVAVRFERDPGRTFGVARVALPLTELRDASHKLREVLSIGFVLGLAIAVVLSTIAAQISSREARALTQVARRMAGGDLDARTGVSGADELGQLGVALDHLARSLSATLEELRNERDLTTGVIEGMQEGLLLLDRERRVALVNPALREMLLLAAGSVGRPLLEVIRHADLVDLLNRAAAEQGPVAGDIEIAGLKPRRLLVRVVPFTATNEGLLTVFVDVTHLRRLETLRRDFVANASHELRTPIAAIQSAAETLESGAKNDPAAAERFIQMIERNAVRLRSLVDDMLELSRVEAHDFRIRLEALPIRPIVEGVVDLFRERANLLGVSVAFEIDASDLRARADRKALEHVLTNLVDNAIKYTGSGSTVRLSARRDPEDVVIEVADDGPGIAPEHLPRLFERFYRVDAGRSRELGGTGLGLAIVKHLSDAMGGAVSVTSALGRGTAFKVRLRPAD